MKRSMSSKEIQSKLFALKEACGTCPSCKKSKPAFCKNGKFKCRDCSKVIKSQKAVKQHIAQHHKKQECELCNQEMKYGELKYHKLFCHQENYKFKCEKCFCAFSRKDHLKQHKKACGDKYKCKNCNSSTKKEKILLDLHIKNCNYHSKKDTEKATLPRNLPINLPKKCKNENGRYDCPFCSYDGPSEASLRKHWRKMKCQLEKTENVMLEIKTSKPFMCQDCGSYYGSPKAAKRHETVKSHATINNPEFIENSSAINPSVNDEHSQQESIQPK